MNAPTFPCANGKPSGTVTAIDPPVKPFRNADEFYTTWPDDACFNAHHQNSSAGMHVFRGNSWSIRSPIPQFLRNNPIKDYLILWSNILFKATCVLLGSTKDRRGLDDEVAASRSRGKRHVERGRGQDLRQGQALRVGWNCNGTATCERTYITRSQKGTCFIVRDEDDSGFDT